MENFEYDFKNKVVTYSGYTGFEELKTRSEKKRNRWLKAREESYYGSIIHFMRSLYADSIAEKGFDVREMIRVYNTDTLFNRIYRPKNMHTVRMRNDTFIVRPGEILPFKKIPEYVDLINMKNFSFKNAVIFDSSKNHKEFYFNNYLQVIYKKEMVKMDYLQINGLPKNLKMNQASDAHLISEEPLIIEKDGSYFNPLNLMSTGYWGWCKMAETLPTDYKIGD